MAAITAVGASIPAAPPGPAPDTVLEVNYIYLHAFPSYSCENFRFPPLPRYNIANFSAAKSFFSFHCFVSTELGFIPTAAKSLVRPEPELGGRRP